MIEYKLLYENSIPPKRAHENDAGMDLFCHSIHSSRVLHDVVIVMFNSGIAVNIPPGYCGLLVPRSSLAQSIFTMPNSIGIIDSGYQGEVKIPLRATTDSPEIFRGLIGASVAQLIVVPVITGVREVKEFSQKTERGEGGFGSTGSLPQNT